MAKSPDAFRTISEVATWLDVPPHVLRFWESRFDQIRPVKGAGGRRYYRPTDMALLAGIKRLLHDQGIQIRGVQKILKEEGVEAVAALSPPIDATEEDEPVSANVVRLVPRHTAEAPAAGSITDLPDDSAVTPGQPILSRLLAGTGGGFGGRDLRPALDRAVWLSSAMARHDA